MYTLALQRELSSIHFLIGGDWGPENQPHSHEYRVEVVLAGDTLDEHGFLVDLEAVEAALDALLDSYRGVTLNDMPAFAGLNPSIEHFSRILCQGLTAELSLPNVNSLSVRVWEDEHAWAMYQSER